MTPDKPDPLTLLTAVDAALGYAAMGWRVLPGAVWRGGKLIDPATDTEVDDIALRPRHEATTDPDLVREWWNLPDDTGPVVLGVAGASLGFVSARNDRAETITGSRWFAARPTPVLDLSGLPLTLFVVRPPFPDGFDSDEIRRFPEDSVIPLPPTTAGGAAVTWRVSPWQTNRTLLTAAEFAELITTTENTPA